MYRTKKQRAAMLDDLKVSFLKTIEHRKDEVLKQFSTKDALTNYVISAAVTALWQTRNLPYETAYKTVIENDAYEPIVEACWATLQEESRVNGRV